MCLGAMGTNDRARFIRGWVAVYGNYCAGVPGLTGPHVAKRKNLTCDHIIPQARGGEDSHVNWQVLCRSCNSKKNAKLITTQHPDHDGHHNLLDDIE